VCPERLPETEGETQCIRIISGRVLGPFEEIEPQQDLLKPVFYLAIHHRLWKECEYLPILLPNTANARFGGSGYIPKSSSCVAVSRVATCFSATYY
jgi:hypothetical protein